MPQFGLRMLLVIVSSTAIGCAWFVPWWNHTKQEAALVADIQILKPLLYYDYQFSELKEHYDPANCLAPAPKFLKAWFGEHLFGSVESFSVTGSSFYAEFPLGTTEVYRYSNEIDDAFQRIGEFKNLRFLSLHGCFGLSDLTMIKTLDKIEDLDLQACGAEDISPLKFASSLKTLNLGNCSSIEDLTPISHLSNLESLDLSQTRLSDYSCLAELPNLKSLSMLNLYEDIEDWSWLGEMKSLEEAWLDSSGLKRLPSLKKLNRLTSIHLSYCADLESTAPLVDVKQLKHLWLGRGAPLQILEHLDELPDLESLYLQGIEVNKEEIASIQSKRPNLAIEVLD